MRAVAFPPGASPRIVATGGAEKKLRIWSLSRPAPTNDSQPNGANGIEAPTQATVIEASDPSCYEVGAGVHTGNIKSIVFTPDDPNILITAAEDKKVRWWDLRTRSMIAEFAVDGNIGSLELTAMAKLQSVNGVSSSASASTIAPPPTEPVLSIAASKSVYFLSGSAAKPAMLLKRFTFTQEMSCVALSPLPARGEEVSPVSPSPTSTRQFVTGSGSDTWVHLFPYSAPGAADAAPAELEIGKGHHGPVWSAAYSPDGKLYATGSEDGTVKLWKVGGAGAPSYGLWK